MTMGCGADKRGSLCRVLYLFFVAGFATADAQEGTTCQCSSYRGCNFNGVCRPSATNCLERNVALGKTASVSSVYRSPDEDSGPACLAVNGNRETIFRDLIQQSDPPNCVHTALGRPSQYWEVDLGREFLISSIAIYGREERGFNTLRKSTVTVDGEKCYKFPSDNKPPVTTVTPCERQLRGRRVRLQKDTTQDTLDYFCLCEFEVWVNCLLNGFYGANCTECGHCQENSVCDYKTGKCPGKCDSGWQGERCDRVCDLFKYGPDCEYKCGSCKDNVSCDRFTGVCSSACQPGYLTQYCNQSCTAGRYGDNCTDTCGNCLNNKTCDPVNGTCLAGCQPGWQNEKCDIKCSSNTYGERCSKTCGRCSTDTKCNEVTGSCDTCQTGFLPPLCNNCEDGKYGELCNHNCTNCDGQEVCDKETGKCLEGCVAGWTSDNCSTPCPPSTYGHQCAERCGNCRLNTTCRHTDGRCEAGCAGDYMDDLCKTEELKKDDGNIPLTATVTSILVIIFILAVIAVVIVIIRKRRQRECGHQRKEDNREESQYYSNIERLSFAADPPSSEISADRRREPKNVKPLTAGKPIQESYFSVQGPTDNIYANTQTTASTLDDTVANTDTLQQLEELEDECDHMYRNDESVYATFKASRPHLDNVQRSLVDLLSSGQLQIQFERLPKGLTDNHEAAKLPVNVKKNRYYSVLPYDKSRVVLTDGYAEEKATDYINANYISGFGHKKTYIATQGPRDNTVIDFWRMVWQENVKQIVMLTGLIEAGKNKCFEYWPSLERSERYGPVTVTGLDVQRRANFLIRKFAIKKAGSQEEREVEQFHYVAWPDHSVPSVTSLLTFWRFVKARGPSRPPPPVLVHCTAGVGRTGTYISLDIAYDHAVAKKEVNVLKIVRRMRQERCIMVQTVEQYIFLHEIVLEAYTARDTLIVADDFSKIFDKPINVSKENKRIDQEFQSVLHMLSVTKQLTTETAAQEVNKALIRNKEALPADDHLVHLTAHVAKSNQFINAVYMSTFLEYQGLILTQLPFQDTVVDFWRLVDGCDVKAIVSLGSDNDQLHVRDACQYWPKDAGTSLTTGPYTLKHKATVSLSNSLTTYVIIVEKKGASSPREVHLLHYRDWDGELPGVMSEFLHFLDTLETLRLKDQKPTPLVVQCLDGVLKCGLFCAVSSIVSRLTFDREVDVYMAVREVHSVRPQAMRSLIQYRYCYQLVQQCVAELTIYANA
ncbi:receptor-type tyrosine-protein phosphatase kappa-like isoform X2 [Pomacea canaliculata]|uniref:receptor-type tyrosine-protein phosphatase kappa-like isoform X2 n=1 Tax=Pomacea canaliculata TaxID=400727 RepID=UPI000D72D71C|nr:receptor-type tyrosine-protein phosphatase kappa-like isoform X2 [Pomacea canaliculata]